ncbi:endonuclease V [Streptomyces fuscigenes]|uniref:endonuclease V n=1 Tax=Streptomyces fuscigenes TaxID=1528880 RepID=UPI001F20D620|nr:endonuclease V [Streptomyces fuscigenes]MCF3965333.1 endonuclease V [Streptomyces fuscigenes]
MTTTSTPADEDEAYAIQDRLRRRLVLDEPGPPPGRGHVTGVDVTYDDEHDVVAAAAVVLDAATLAVVEEATAVGPVPFPYVPGLLAFREVPAVLAALDRLGADPGMLVCDGYGLAHPRRFGLACHLGVVTGLPSIGVAKSPFLFSYEQPGRERGDWTPLTAPEGDVVGRALRTRKGVKPVFVSAGHRVELANACAHALRLAAVHRLSETTRAADSLSRRALREATAGRGLCAGPPDS